MIGKLGTLNELAKHLEAERGELTLFAALLGAEPAGRWLLVIAAPWLTNDVQSAGDLAQRLMQAVGDDYDCELFSSDPHEPYVRAILEAWEREGRRAEIGGHTFHGLQGHFREGYIVRPVRAAML